MKFFLDTAIVEEIKKAKELGMLDGVTTNPTLIQKSGRPFKEVLKEICSLTEGPVSAEVTALDADGMINEGEELAGISDNIVIKIPCTTEGLKAIRGLADNRINTNATLCFSPSQALMVAKAGATYVSPFVGRLDDIAQDGMQLIRDIKLIYDNYEFPTEIIVASIRHPMHVVDAAKAGAHIATIPYSSFEKLMFHPLTDAGIKRFLEDWENAKK